MISIKGEVNVKKLISILTIFILSFMGCNSITSQNQNEDDKKQSKIEVYSIQDNKFVKSIDNQETINYLLNTEHWKDEDNLPEDLVPEYKLFVYQEKTLLSGQNPDEEREYELIETITTFQNSSYIQDVISDNVITAMSVPEDALIFYYSWNDATMKQFHEIFR